MNIKDINTDNKTITLPLSEYLNLIDENKNKNYYKILDKVIKSINSFRAYTDITDLISSDKKKFIDTRLNQAFQANGLELSKDGSLIEI